MYPQHTENISNAMESSASSCGNLDAESSPSMTQAASNNADFNSDYNTVLPTNAPVKRFIRKITHIDPKKLQEAGLDRKIAEVIRNQKLQLGTSSKLPETTISYTNKITPTTSSSASLTIPSRPSSASSVIQLTGPPTASKSLSTNTIIPPKITITAPEGTNETDRHNMEGLNPEERLKQVKHLLNQKLLLKKISNQPGMSIHLKPPASTSPSAHQPKKLLNKLPTLANTTPPPPPPPKGFTHLVESTGETTPNQPVTKNKTPQKSPQDIARKLDFQTEHEKKPSIIQYVRNNSMTFLNKTDIQSSHKHSKKMPESIDDIPKASIKQANPKKEIIRRRQKINYPEVSPLKVQFPTVNIPQETPLPTIDSFKKPYPMTASNYYPIQNETQSHSGAIPLEFSTTNCETPILPLSSTHQIQNNDKNLNETTTASPNCLIVLENKILSQDEMIDLTALRLSTSKTPQRFARPHKPIPEVVIKQEKLDDFPTTSITHQNTNTFASKEVQQSSEYMTKTNIGVQKDSAIEMVHLPAKPNKKIIVNAQKLKLPQEKIAELAKKIAQSTATKTKPQKQTISKGNSPVKSVKKPAMRIINTKAIYKTKTLTKDNKPDVTFNSPQTSIITTEIQQNSKYDWSNETPISISTDQNQVVMIKQEPKTPQISPPKEVLINPPENHSYSSLIQPLPPQGLQKVLIKSRQTNICPSTQFNASFTANRKSAVEIVDESSDSEDCFSAVDFLASFGDTNPITEETTLELSPEELNLSASCAMNLSPLRIPTNLPQKQQQTIQKTSSQYIPNEIGKIVDLNEVKTIHINSQNVRTAMDNSQTMNTIVIQSSNGPETIVTKTAENKWPRIKISGNKLKQVKILNVLDSTKMGLEKLKDLESIKYIAPKNVSKEEKDYSKPTESRTKANDSIETNIPAKVSIRTPEKSNLKTTLPTEINKQNYMQSVDSMIQTNLSNITTEKSTVKTAVKPLEKSIKTPVKSTDKSAENITNLSNKTIDKSTKMTVKTAVKPLEKLIQTSVKSTDKSAENITQSNLANKTIEKSTEMTFKTAVKPLEKSMQKPVKSTDKSAENITKTSLSNYTTEKSTQMTVKTAVKPLEKSSQSPVKSTDKSAENITHLANNTIEKSTKMTVKTAVKPLEKLIQTPIKSTEITVKTAVKPLEKLIQTPFKSTDKSAENITQTNLANKTIEKSTDMTIKTAVKPLEKSLQTPVKSMDKSAENITQTNLANNTIEKSTEMTSKTAIKPFEKSRQTPVKSTDKSAENITQTNLADNTTEQSKELTDKTLKKSIEIPVKSTDKSVENILKSDLLHKEVDKNTLLESVESRDANANETIDTNIKTKDVDQNNMTPKTLEESSVKSPEKSINLKSILKLTMPCGDVVQLNSAETSDANDAPQDENETKKPNELKSIPDTEPPKTNESNSQNTMPSKRISRFKKGKINLVARNKPGTVTKKSIETNAEDKNKANKEDLVERDDSLSGTTLNIGKSVCATEKVIIENEDKASKENNNERNNSLDESRNISQSECVSKEIDVEIKAKDKVTKDVCLNESSIPNIIESINAAKTMEANPTSEENNIEDERIETFNDNIIQVIDNPEPQSIDKQNQLEASQGPDPTESITDTITSTFSPPQNETVTSNLDKTSSNLKIIETGKGEREVEPKQALPENKEDKLNTDNAGTDKIIAKTPSQSLEDVQGKDLHPTMKPIETPSRNISQLLKPPKMPKRKSESKVLENIVSDSVQVLEELKQAKISLVNIAKHSSIDISPNLPKIPFKRKSKETVNKPEEKEPPKGIKTLLQIKKSKEKDNKIAENDKPKENETNLLKSNISKLIKTNENRMESDVSSEEPITSGKEAKTRSDRSSLQKTDKSTMKANESYSKNQDDCSPLMGRRSLRFSLNSKPETPTATPTLVMPSRTRHTSRHQISDDDLEFLPVNAEIKKFRITRKSLNENKDKIIQSSTDNSKRKRLSSKLMETEDSIEIVLNKPHNSEITKGTARLSVKTIEPTPTVSSTKRSRISCHPSVAEDNNRDKQLAFDLAKRTRFSSQSQSEAETNHHKLSVVVKRIRLPSRPTDPEDSCQESPYDIMKLSHTKQRKKLRKTLEDIKRSSQKPHPDTDSDEDYRDFDSIIDLEDENEFLGFDENCEKSSKLQKNKEQVNVEVKSQITSTTKATQGGTLKNWLTTGKAISPTPYKDTHINRRRDEINTCGIPLKKRWDMAENLNEETDITDDTSPADDEDERDPIRGFKTVINSNTKILANKKIKLNITKNTNHKFLEPRPVANKSNADSVCQELSKQSHQNSDILAPQENSKTTKAQDKNIKRAKIREDISLKKRSTETLKSITLKLNDKRASFEDNKKIVAQPIQSDVSTEDDSIKTQEFSNNYRSSKAKSKKQDTSKICLDQAETKDVLNKIQDSSSRSSKAKSNKMDTSRVCFEKTHGITKSVQSDLSVEDESNKTQNTFTKCKSSKAKSKKQVHSDIISLEKTQDISCTVQIDLSITKDSNDDESSSSGNKKKTHKAENFSENALDIVKPTQNEEFSQLKTITSEESKKLSKEFQIQETPKSKKTKATKEKNQLSKVHKESEKTKHLSTEHKTEIKESLIKGTKPTSSKKQKKEVTASDLSENFIEFEVNANNSLEKQNKLETSKENVKLSDECPESTSENPSDSNNIPLAIEDTEAECSPQIPQNRGRKRKILKVDDSSNDDSKPQNSLQPKATPHLSVINNDSSTETSTPIKKRNVDTTTANFDPRLLLITKREQIDTDEILTETNPGTGPIECGLCLKRTTAAKWTLHLAEHYGVGWQVGKPKVNVGNRNTVFNNITSYFKTTEIKGLSCRMCKKLYRSALGLIQHLESCGTPALRLTCEYCNKNYSKLTMPIHQRSCSERTKLEKSLSEKVTAAEEPQEEVFSNTGRLKRHSTIKAETKLKVIGAELQQNAEQIEFQPRDHLRFVPPLDKEEVHAKWCQDIEKFGKGFCPTKICKFNSPNVEELEEHILQCKLIKTGYFCTFCRRACFKTEQVALDHISNMHKPGKDFSDDSSDSDIKTEAEQSSDDDNDLSEGVAEDETDNERADEEEVDDEEDYAQPNRIKKRIIVNKGKSAEAIAFANRKRVYETRAVDINKEVIGKWKNFLSLNYSSDPLLPHLTCHYSIIKNKDFAKYLPPQESSMKFSLEKQCKLNTNVGNPNPNVEWTELKRFETLDNKFETFCFLGAPVKFCSWVPLPADVEEQYIVVGYRKEMFNFVKFSQPKAHHTILMIFKITQDKKLPKVEIHYGFIINDGPVHGVEFLPSGGYNVNTNRLGLIAVATIHSAIKVYSLPIQVDIEECDKIENVALIDVTANFVLNLDVIDQEQTEHVVMNPQCLAICWSEFLGHNHIFASYSNGFVGIWDITDDPQENLNRFVVENVVCYAPINYFYNGEKGSNCIAVHYDTNGPRWLAVSAKCRKLVIYDIHNFMRPVILKDDCSKNILRCLNWSPVWGPMLAGYCDSMPNNGRTVFCISATNIMFSHQRYENMVSAVSYIDYSPVTNLLVSAADNGDILFADPRELHYESGLGKKFGMPRRILSSMDVKQLDNKPIVRPPLKQSKTDIKLPNDWTVHEPNYKDKYGLVFNPPFKLKEEHKTKYYNDNRRAPLNITPLMRVNTINCNLNFGAKRLVAAGYENGFMRIIYFNKETHFSNWKKIM